MISTARLASALCWCLLCSFAAAKAPRQKRDLCLQSCESALAPAPFGDKLIAPAAAGKTICRSRLALTSLYLCLVVFCDREARSKELATLNETCLGLRAGPVPPITIVSNYTAGDIERLRHIELYEEFAPGETVDEVVFPALPLYKAWFDTLVRTVIYCVRGLVLTLSRMPLNMSAIITFSMVSP